MTTTKQPTTVHVTEEQIRIGIAGNRFRCAVGLALYQATGDTESNIFEDDFRVRIEVHGRSVLAPWEVQLFVWEYDELERKADGRVKLPRPLPEGFRPFSFTLPAWDDPEWKEACHGCEGLCDPKELDDEGCCEECRRNNLAG